MQREINNLFDILKSKNIDILEQKLNALTKISIKIFKI